MYGPVDQRIDELERRVKTLEYDLNSDVNKSNPDPKKKLIILTHGAGPQDVLNEKIETIKKVTGLEVIPLYSGNGGTYVEILEV